MLNRITSSLAACVLLAAVVAGCASNPPAPKVRVNADPSANFSSYGTFGFPEQTGTDRAGYSTIVTSYFKNSVRKQMEQRGYHFVDANPDLLVNFFANVREHTEVRSEPTFAHAYGYYGYRFGLYDAWPLYDRDVRTITYPIGTANIDIVDAHKKQMIWEGVAEGRIRDQDMDQPQETIERVVTQLFTRFPGRAGVGENTDSGGR